MSEPAHRCPTCGQSVPCEHISQEFLDLLEEFMTTNHEALRRLAEGPRGETPYEETA